MLQPEGLNGIDLVVSKDRPGQIGQIDGQIS
jgi:hypothetical protein